MQIVPACFVKDGKLAAFKAGNFTKIDFLDIDPYDMINKLDRLNMGHIGIVDIDASKGEKGNSGLVGSLANTSVAKLHVGGGISDLNYLKSLQYAGVDDFILGSAVHENKNFLKEIAEAGHVKNDHISIALDIKDGKLYFHGWKDEASISVNHFIQESIHLGFTRFLVTDVTSKPDEVLPDVDFYESLITHFPTCTFVAAGRLDTWKDVDAMAEIGVNAIVVGNRIFKDDSLLAEVAMYNKRNA